VQKVPFTTGYLTEHCADDAFATLAGYEARGGYATARRVLEKGSPEEVIETLRASGLQGRGRAGYSAAGRSAVVSRTTW
jgi:NADH:ubiquinone oxidoreductase subunit F (NADH-binding)